MLRKSLSVPRVLKGTWGNEAEQGKNICFLFTLDIKERCICLFFLLGGGDQGKVYTFSFTVGRQLYLFSAVHQPAILYFCFQIPEFIHVHIHERLLRHS